MRRVISGFIAVKVDSSIAQASHYQFLDGVASYGLGQAETCMGPGH